MTIEDIFQTMRELVAEHFAVEPAEVKMETVFEEDLGGLKTVGDAVNYIASKVK